jgi:hypothetical protein
MMKCIHIYYCLMHYSGVPRFSFSKSLYIKLFKKLNYQHLTKLHPLKIKASPAKKPTKLYKDNEV